MMKSTWIAISLCGYLGAAALAVAETAPAAAKPPEAAKAVAPAVDTNAVASMMAEEKSLSDESKLITRKISALQKPLRDARRKALEDDKELQALSDAVAAREKELEAKLFEKYPDVAAKDKESKALFAQYSDVAARLKAVRTRLDQLRKQDRVPVAPKKEAGK